MLTLDGIQTVKFASLLDHGLLLTGCQYILTGKFDQVVIGRFTHCYSPCVTEGLREEGSHHLAILPAVQVWP